MRKFLCILMATAVSAGLTAPSMGEVDIEALADGNNMFACDLYARLKDAKGNLFFSPYSISTALGMTYMGARNNTEKEMGTVLHFAGPRQSVAERFLALQHDLQAIQERGKVKLDVANAIWAQKDYQFLPEYLGVAEKFFSSRLSGADFVNRPEETRAEINSWVEEKTRDKIKDLIAKGALDAMTRMVLVNAIYFKGDWLNTFPAEDTEQDAEFFVSAEKTVKAPMMRQKENFPYTDDGSVQVLQLPYSGEELSMLVILPKDRNGIAEVEKSLSGGRLKAWTDKLHDTKVLVDLPKFKAESSFGLSETLSAMGMKNLFSPGTADLSGMDGSKNLFVSAVIHKAFVEVDEKGTEAAAATAVMVSLTAMMPVEPEPEFRADHPFIFLIRENSTGSILFMGRVNDPSPGN